MQHLSFPQPPPAPHCASPRPWRLCLLLLTALLLGAAGPASAQLVQRWEDRHGAELGDDIIIEGLGFSKLILALAPGEGIEGNRQAARLSPLIEKNLCWSGLFKLTAGGTDHCAVEGEASRIDMRLELAVSGDRLTLRLRDTGPEGAVLFQDGLALALTTGETAVMAVINRLTERITGQRGLLGSTIAFVLRRPDRPKVIVATTTHGERMVRLSTNAQINLLPRWSPGGDRLVFTVLGRHGTRVYIRHLIQTQQGNDGFITPDGGLNSGGSFSPDGKRLVLTMSPQGTADLFELTMEGRQVRRLTSRSGIETQADWSPDGSKIVFVSDRTGTPQVYLLDTKTGDDLRLTFDSNYNADPKWSPDGKRILFTKRFAGRDQIYIMDQYGENVRPVTRSRYDAEQPEWSPDGHQIVFTSNRTGEFKLYVVSTDGSALRRLTNTPQGFEESSPAWTIHQWVE